MAKRRVDRLNETLDQIAELARSYPRAFGNVSPTWLRDTLFDVLSADPYLDINEVSDDIALGDRGILRLPSATKLRHLTRLTLLVHRILGYHSSEQTQQFRAQIRDLDDTRTQNQLSLQLARGVQLSFDSLHDWLIKTLAADGGSLVHYYNQGEDGRLNALDLTEGGWCLGVSTQWVRFRAMGRADFWQWMLTQEAASAFRFVMASQGVRSGADLSERAAFALRRFGVIKESVLTCDSPQLATPQAMASNIVNGPYQLRRIGQSYVSGGGHAMAAATGTSFTFMDPNAGEMRFTSGAQLMTWLPKFVRRIGYEFARHYVETYSYQPNLARVDQPRVETPDEIMRNAMAQRRRGMGY